MPNALVAGNWKMHGTAASAAQLASQLARQWADADAAEVIVFPPAVHIATVASALVDSSVAIGAQTCRSLKAEPLPARFPPPCWLIWVVSMY